MSFDSHDAPVVIALEGAAKRYARRAEPARRLWQVLWGHSPSQDPLTQFTALQPCTLRIRQGEVVGIVGKNGAGKSTLLQMVSRTLQPSEGRVQVTGHVSAILELGAGFNPEFTGRENIHLGLATAGLSKAQTLARLEEIIDFSGIRPFIDQPIKTFSSGMYVRLAFAIATCSEPDILVIDEALSVGDGEFARKSFDRILQLKQRGTTILFCSHSLFHIEALCSRAVWIEAGQVVRDGHPHQVIPAYQDFLDGAALPGADGATPSSGLAAASASETADQPRSGPAVPASSGRLRELRFEVRRAEGERSQWRSGDTASLRSRHDTLVVRARFDARPDLPAPAFAVTLNSMDGRIIASAGSWIDGLVLERDAAGSGWVDVAFEALALLKGSYTVSVFLFCERGLHIYDNADHVLQLQVTQEDLEQGLFHLPRRWSSHAQDPL